MFCKNYGKTLLRFVLIFSFSDTCQDCNVCSNEHKWGGFNNSETLMLQFIDRHEKL